MTEKIKLIQGDTRPALVCTITDETSGNPIDLTDATVEMKFRIVGSDVLQATIPGSLTNPIAGVVKCCRVSLVITKVRFRSPSTTALLRQFTTR